MRKSAEIDFERCTPLDCQASGGCKSMAACRRSLLEQEGADEPPMLLSAVACVGCGDCAAVCPYGAVSISAGL